MSQSSRKAPAGEPRHEAQTLHRQLGKPAGDWAADDLVSFVRDRDIRVLSLMHVGGDGWLKTLDFVPRDSAHLADVLSGGDRTDNEDGNAEDSHGKAPEILRCVMVADQGSHLE